MTSDANNGSRCTNGWPWLARCTRNGLHRKRRCVLSKAGRGESFGWWRTTWPAQRQPTMDASRYHGGLNKCALLVAGCWPGAVVVLFCAWWVVSSLLLQGCVFGPGCGTHHVGAVWRCIPEWQCAGGAAFACWVLAGDGLVREQAGVATRRLVVGWSGQVQCRVMAASSGNGGKARGGSEGE